MLDAAGVTTKVKELHEANNAKKTEVCLLICICNQQGWSVKDVIKILNVLKAEVEPTEELLKVHTLTFGKMLN